MKTIFAVTIALSLGAMSATAVEAQLPNKQYSNTLAKKQTSDPYFSTPAQSAAEQNSAKSVPKPIPSSNQTEIWKSLSRKTSKPVQRIDFSQLQVDPAVKADLLKTASAWNAPTTHKQAASTTAQTNKGAVTIDFSIPAISPPAAKALQQVTRATPVTPQKPTAVNKTSSFSGLTPLAPLDVPKTAAKRTASPIAATPSIKNTGPLSPLPKPSLALPQPKQLTATPVAKPLNPVGNWKSEFKSPVQQATYQEPAGGSFVPGSNTKKIITQTPEFSATPQTSQPLLTQQEIAQGYRIADSSTVFNSNQGPQTSSPANDSYIDLNQATSYNNVVGESFEPSRVVALVGGEPIFVGDMMFEVNQLIEKHMNGAPESAKVQQRGNLIKRLLPKYVDQKMLFLSTTSALPEGANLEDVISQAEKTFNKQALPDMMKRTGITSTAQFDGNLRAQGSSIRQMRRSWAKDQVGRFLLAEQVSVNQDVTHRELLDAYRESYDSYANIAKCRWEKIELKFSKSGGRFPAKDKMDDIYQRLVHGGNFQAIAKKESHGFKASKGGQHDWTNRGSLVSKKVDEAIFTLPQGRLSEIIETKDSFLVVRVIERVDAYHTPFEETQGKIKRKIVNKRRDREFKKYLEKIRKQIPVEYPEG